MRYWENRYVNGPWIYKSWRVHIAETNEGHLSLVDAESHEPVPEATEWSSDGIRASLLDRSCLILDPDTVLDEGL